MSRKLMVILGVLVLVGLTTTTVFAGRYRVATFDFKLGSLIADGSLTGLGNQDVTVELDASGIPLVTCTNQGGNQAPGQNPPKVSATGTQFLSHNIFTKNGTSPFNVETNDPQLGLTAKQMGCPNNNWKAKIDFVFWTQATIKVHTGDITGPVGLKQDFACTTTHNPDSVTCTPTN